MKRLRKELRKVQLSSSDKEQSMSEESDKAGDKGAEVGAENIERRGARLEGEERVNSFVVQKGQRDSSQTCREYINIRPGKLDMFHISTHFLFCHLNCHYHLPSNDTLTFNVHS